MKHALTIAIVVIFASCKREQPPVVITDQPHFPPVPVVAPDVGITPEPDTVGRWSGTPPHRGGVQYELVRTSDAVRISRGSATLEFPPPQFSECLEQIPEVETPADMPLSKVHDDPIWLQASGGGEAASIRLSTRGALLAVNDGCVRVADLGPSLFNALPSDDLLFAADTLAPDDSADAPEFLSIPDGAGTLIQHDGAPWIEVSHFPGAVTLSARGLGDQRWVRLAVSTERETHGGEKAVGREHTLVWTSGGGDPPFLTLENDFRFGANGPDHEENRTSATRSYALTGGILTVTGERQSIDDAMNVGAGRCPEMEGVLAFRHRNEVATWTFTPTDGKPIAIGEATRRATFASGCLDVALRESSRRKRMLSDRADSTQVSWKPAAQATVE